MNVQEGSLQPDGAFCLLTLLSLCVAITKSPTHTQPVQAGVMEDELSTASFATRVNYSQPPLHAVVEMAEEEETDEEEGSIEEEEEEHGEDGGSDVVEVKAEEPSNEEVQDEEKALHGHQQKLRFPEHM